MARLPSLVFIWKMINFSLRREELPVLSYECRFKMAGEALTLEDSRRRHPSPRPAGRKKSSLDRVYLLSKVLL